MKVKAKAVFLIGDHTFLKLEVENHDQSANFVRQDAERFADKLGITFMYLEDIEE